MIKTNDYVFVDNSVSSSQPKLLFSKVVRSRQIEKTTIRL